MKNKAIQITGIATTPEYQDGSCMSLLNAKSVSGDIIPVGDCMQLNDYVNANGYEYIFAHNIPNGGVNYIGIKDNSLYWIDLQDDTKTKKIYENNNGILTNSKEPITQIGNYINVLCNDCISNILFSNNNYNTINIPELQVDVRSKSADKAIVSWSGIYSYGGYEECDGGLKDRLFASKGLKEKNISIAKKDGYLTGYMKAIVALELYDGSYVNYSQPFLISIPHDNGNRYNITDTNTQINYDYINNNIIYLPIIWITGDKTFPYSKAIGIIPGQLEEGMKMVVDINTNSIENIEGYAYIDPNKLINVKYGKRYIDGQLNGYDPIVDEYFGDNDFTSMFPTPDHSRVPNYSYYPKALHDESGQAAGTRVPDSRILQITYLNKLQINIKNNFENIKDIIRGVSIFLTTETQLEDTSDAKYMNSIFGSCQYWAMSGVKSNAENYFGKIKTNKELKKDIENNDKYYLAKSLSIDYIEKAIDEGNKKIEWDGYIDIDLEDITNDVLINSKELPVESARGNKVAVGQYAYNTQLHIFGIKDTMFNGYIPFSNVYPKYYNNDNQFPNKNITPCGDKYEGNRYIFYTKTFIKTSDGDVIRYRTDKTLTINITGELDDVLNSIFSYVGDLRQLLSYPDSRAYKMDVVFATEFGLWKYKYEQTFKLTPSDTQNYSYYLSDDIKPITFTLQATTEDLTKYFEINDDINESLSTSFDWNRIDVSNINNPLVYSSEKTYRVGTGKILNICSNAKITSDGQFGQYPLYIFTDEGVYSLETGNIGTAITYNRSAISSLNIPISNIVCPTPYGVVYVGKTGINIISGNNVVETISHVIKENQINININNSNQIGSILTNSSNIKDILYNHKENEMQIMYTLSSLHYFYNFYSKIWTLSNINYINTIKNTSPELYFWGNNGKIYDINKRDTLTSNFELLTRPLRLITDETKKLNRIVIKGNFFDIIQNDSNDKIFGLYGSDDGYTFSVIKDISLINNTQKVNIKDIDFGIISGTTYRYYLIKIALKSSVNTQIRAIDAIYTDDYMADKIR